MQSPTLSSNKIPNSAQRLLVKALVDILVIKIFKKQLALVSSENLDPRYTQIINKNLWDLI